MKTHHTHDWNLQFRNLSSLEPEPVPYVSLIHLSLCVLCVGDCGRLLAVVPGHRVPSARAQPDTTARLRHGRTVGHTTQHRVQQGREQAAMPSSYSEWKRF
jgi:hypothetical protein